MKWISILICLAPISAASLPVLLSRTGSVHTETITLKALDSEHQYSVLYSIGPLRTLSPDARVSVEVRQGQSILASKTLHSGDADYYTQFRVPHRGDVSLEIRAAQTSGAYTLQVNRWPLSGLVRSGPNHRWQDAIEVRIGNTIFASGDDAEYIPLPNTPRRANIEATAGLDWYKFEFAADTPKLVFFQVDLMERDQIPANVSIYRMADGALKEYFEGEDPVTLPHEVQALPGNKFTPRTLTAKGTYYISVRANHPEYKLRPREYDPPPTQEPHVAAPTATST